MNSLHCSASARGSLRNILLLIGVILLFTSFVIALHVITIQTPSYNEDITNRLNITVNNTDGDDANITQVNITLPSSFEFLFDSNETSAGAHTFTNTTTVLSWEGDDLVLNLTFQHFLFNATASTPGNFNITVETTNSTFTSTSNLTVVINDTTVPDSIEIVAPSEADGANISKSDIVVNVTASDNGVIDTILVRLYNSTGDVVNSTTSSTSSVFLNTSGLDDGTYQFNATVNDSANNVNNSVTRTVAIDTSFPQINYTTGTQADGVNVSATSIFINVSVTEANEANITFSIFNDTVLVNSTTFTTAIREYNLTNLTEGNYTYNVTLFDTSSNSNTTETRSLTIDTTAPSIAFSCDDTSVQRDDTITCTCTSTDNVDQSPSISFTTNPSTSSTGTFTTSCTVTDDAGNSVTSDIGYTVSSSGGGGGGSYSPPAWTNTFAQDDKELSEKDPITKTLGEKERISVLIDGEKHNVGIIEVRVNEVVVNVSSAPTQATIALGESEKFEVTDDTIYDLEVTLVSIAGNEATLTIEALSEEIPAEEVAEEKGAAEVVGEVLEEVAEKAGANRGILIAIIIIAIVIAAIIAMRRRKPKYS